MSYFKFLNLVEAVRQLPSFPALDAAEERLLNTFATRWHAGVHISVVEAMNLLPEISPSTAHRRLKTLRQKGLIALSPDKTDSRIKYVVATPKTEEYFGTLQDCLTRAQT